VSLDPSDPAWPPEDALRRVHERFVREIVEGLNVCPFARKSRELGRVHRPVFRVGRGDPTPEQCANAVADLLEAHPDTEIVLLTFPVPPGHSWSDATTFDQFVAQVRDTYKDLGRGPVFYMVGFHPTYGIDSTREPTAESLVPLLRRTPDPVIQCVRAETLDAVRRQAQEVARDRMRKELTAINPELAAMFDQTIQPDPELSADIARQNFASVGTGEGRERLEKLIAEIKHERDIAYGVAEDE
jgi:hypothetical protein